MNDYKTAIELFLDGKTDKHDPFKPYRPYLPGNCLVHIPARRLFLMKGYRIRYIYLLLKGTCFILDDNPEGHDYVAAYAEVPHLFGLFEHLSGSSRYSAYLRTNTECWFIRIPADIYLALLKTDLRICHGTLLLIADIASGDMRNSKTRMVFSPKDILGNYLYENASEELPYICPLKRTDMAQLLNINLRSLYRYLSDLEKDGMLIHRHGKLIVEEEHYKRLRTRYNLTQEEIHD